MARRGRDGSNLLVNAVIAVAVLLIVLVAAGSVLAARAVARRDAPAAGRTRSATATATATAAARPSAQATISPAVATSAVIPAAKPATDQVVPVLMYHHVMPDPNNSIAITPEMFDRQMGYLSEQGYHAVGMAEFTEFRRTGKRLPEKPVLITFDDGRMNQYTHALPILEKYGFTATFFVNKKWVEGSSDSFMHAEELRDLVARGFDVESHTMDHTFLVRSRSEDYEDMKERLWGQTDGMRRWLSEITGKPVTALALPGGAQDEHTARLAEEAGYLTAFTTVDGVNRCDDPDPRRLYRYNAGALKLSFESYRAIFERAERSPRRDDDAASPAEGT